MIDIHCHILPGVDDGSRSKEESLAMIRRAVEVGIDRIVCTPHYCDSSFSQKDVTKAFEWFREEADKAGVSAHLGYEIHWRKVSELGIETIADHVIEDTEFALVEFSMNSEIGQLELRSLWKLRGQGIIPIIAHPERYRAIQENLLLADELKDAGCLMQMSTNVIGAGMFSPARKACKHMLKHDLYDYISSDAHCPEDYDDYAKAIRRMSNLAEAQIDFFAEED